MWDYMQGDTHYLKYMYMKTQNLAVDHAHFPQYQSSTKLITQNQDNVFHQKMSYR